MPSYAQWRHSADKGQVARVTWLCGDQRVLVEEVIEETKRILGVTEFDYIPLSAECDSPLAIWDAAYQYSLDPDANRLVLVREADKLTEWAALARWFADSRHMVNTYLLFVSDQPDLPTVPDTKGELMAHVELIKAKGKTVKCSMPNEHELAQWIKRNSTFGDASVKFLLERAGSDLPTIANVCKKSQMFKSDPGSTIIAHLAEEFSLQSFTDALIFNNKKSALLELERTPVSDYGKLIAQLYSRLDTLHILHKAAPNFNTIKEMSAATGVKIFIIQRYLSTARAYDRNKITKCRNVLTVADDAVQRHATDGVMELLVTLW